MNHPYSSHPGDPLHRLVVGWDHAARRTGHDTSVGIVHATLTAGGHRRLGITELEVPAALAGTPNLLLRSLGSTLHDAPATLAGILQRLPGRYHGLAVATTIGWQPDRPAADRVDVRVLFCAIARGRMLALTRWPGRAGQLADTGHRLPAGHQPGASLAALVRGLADDLAALPAAGGYAPVPHLLPGRPPR